MLPLISSLPMVNDHVTHTEDKYSTRAIVDHSLDFLKEHRARTPDKPFFLYLDFTAPHFPPQADIDLY
ncbi:MAG: sulfatase-like hydrolase/transferase, partial [Planctomycetota bacterium]|nr:sulfatase-like hydrolase/transferase [Planctomycetota bacterium]